MVLHNARWAMMHMLLHCCYHSCDCHVLGYGVGLWLAMVVGYGGGLWLHIVAHRSVLLYTVRHSVARV